MVKKSRTIPQASANPAAAEFAGALHNKVTPDAMMAHLSKLQDIANANNGTRAVGTPGYEAGVDYVVNTLRNTGFDVQTPEFSAGLFSGAEVKKSAEQAKLWGGAADQPFDPNYHQKTDTLDHIDRTSLGINGAGVAYAVALYAQDLGGPNGVPMPADRTRHVLAKP
jgi:Zn-dependent M28 family amino/carboxypeptidase